MIILRKGANISPAVRQRIGLTGRRLFRDEGDAVLVHRGDTREGFDPHSLRADDVAAGLVGLLDHDARARHGCARVVDELGNEIGKLAEIMETPAANVYVVRGEKEHLIPAVPAFILKTDVDAGVIVARLIEGM